MTFPKTREYVETLYSVTKLLIEKAKTSEDPKLNGIARLIYMYFLKSCNELKLRSNDFSITNSEIDITSLMEYISQNNIQLYDLKYMSMSEMDYNNVSDIERYTLSHILYIIRNN
jgi:hypothetical protein